MTYRIKRAQMEQRETLELLSADGGKSERLEVTLRIPRIAGELRGLLLTLMHAQEAVRDAAGGSSEVQIQALQQAEQASDQLLLLIFGQEGKERLLSFFDRDYVELVQQITPFVSEVVQPAVHRYVTECRKRAVKGRRHAAGN